MMSPDLKPSWTAQCTQITQNVLTKLDDFAQRMLTLEDGHEGRHRGRRSHGVTQLRTSAGQGRLLTPEEDVRQLILTAQSLDDLWAFFQRRLNRNQEVDFLCFAVLDQSTVESNHGLIRIQFVDPQPEAVSLDSVGGFASEASPLDLPLISLNDSQNHWAQAFLRKDTTFTNHRDHLGEAMVQLIEHSSLGNRVLNLFTVPFIADDRTIATMTLGFQEVDAFSQARLSYLYTLRDQVAQLIWNLMLKDRMKSQAQMDSLTGLITHSTFQQVLGRELTKAHEQASAVTCMLLGINNLSRINQEFGHAVGDEAICALASTVRRLIRGLDTVARYGGDEIAVVLPETDGKTADTIAERFLSGLKEQKSRQFPNLDFTISVGYATYPEDTKHQETLLKYSEQALQLAKFRGDKAGGSSRVPFRSTKMLNDKTILEVFASHVAKKYDNHGVYQQLIHAIDRSTGAELEDTPTINPDALMLETIGSLAGALDAKDRYTRGHSQAVANYAVALAHAIQMTPDEVEQVRLAAFLHDIGKIGIPEAILCKEGPLNEKEWEIMKQHPVIGARQILAPVTALKDVIPLVEFHHENWDGSGYPSGLKGEEIPIGARIVAIVDAFHGLTSDRSYRKALPIDQAAEMLKSESGVKWDPQLLNVFMKILNIASPRHTAVAHSEETTVTAVSAIEQSELSTEASVAY